MKSVAAESGVNQTRTVCLFVASSDNTKDVFDNVKGSYEKFWRNCRYRKYVGLNSTDSDGAGSFDVITTSVADWRAELLLQIQALADDTTHILLMLDDFLLLSPVDEERLHYLVTKAVAENYDYVRLVPLTSALLWRAFRQIRNRLLVNEFEAVPLGAPYFSSLQPALWKREHLVAMLQLSGSIWDFESQSIPGAKHYAITQAPPIRCVHVVEKGQWMPDAALRFRKLQMPFSPGGRPQRPLSEIPLLWYRQCKFALIGYSGVRARNILSRFP